MPHVDDGLLHAWLDRERSGLTPAALAEIEAHLALCDECASRLEAAHIDRGRAADILAAAGPARVTAPDFESLANRAADGEARGMRPRPRRNLVSLAWAASLVAALGVGWMTRDLFRPEQLAISTAPATDRSMGEGSVSPAAPAQAPTATGPSTQSIAAPGSARAADASIRAVASASVQGAGSAAEPMQESGSVGSATRSDPAVPRAAIAMTAAPPPPPPAAVPGPDLPPATAPADADSPPLASVALDQVVVTGVASRARTESREASSPAPPAPAPAPTTVAFPQPAGPTVAAFAPMDFQLGWTTVSLAEAGRRLGTPILTHPDLPIVSIAARTEADGTVVRVLHALGDGSTLVLDQRVDRPFPILWVPGDSPMATSRRGPIHLHATAPLTADSVRILLEGVR